MSIWLEAALLVWLCRVLGVQVPRNGEQQEVGRAGRERGGLWPPKGLVLWWQKGCLRLCEGCGQLEVHGAVREIWADLCQCLEGRRLRGSTVYLMFWCAVCSSATSALPQLKVTLDVGLLYIWFNTGIVSSFRRASVVTLTSWGFVWEAALCCKPRLVPQRYWALLGCCRNEGYSEICGIWVLVPQLLCWCALQMHAIIPAFLMKKRALASLCKAGMVLWEDASNMAY